MAGPLILPLSRLNVSLVSASFLLSSPILFPGAWLVLAQVAGSIDSEAFSIVCKGGGMSKALSPLPAQLIKVLLPVEKSW